MDVKKTAFRGLFAALAVLLLFTSQQSVSAATLPVTVVLSPASVMLGSDTLSLSGNTFTATLDSTTSPAAQFPVGSLTLTASPATAPGIYEGLINQTVTINGVAATTSHFVRVSVTAGGVHSGSIGETKFHNFTVPEGAVTMGAFGTGVTVPAAPGTNTANFSETFGFTPLPTAPNQFLVYSTYASGQVGGLTGNLFGGIGPEIVTLAPNVPATVRWNQFTNWFARAAGNAGASTQAAQTFTVQGVSQTVTRTATLIATPVVNNSCPNATNLGFSPAVTLTFDLGARGKVDLTVAIPPHLGENPQPPNCTPPGPLTVIPSTVIPILLHSVPAVPGPTTPPSTQPVATAVATATSTIVPAVFVPPVIPQGVQNPSVIGIFGPGNRTTPVVPRASAAAQQPPAPGAQAVTGPVTLRPPSTGDAGLASKRP